MALNWKDAGIMVSLECEADADFFEHPICGFHLKEQTSWQIQKTRRFDKSIYPEVWFVRDWPAVPLREDLTGTMSWNYDGIPKHPFSGQSSAGRGAKQPMDEQHRLAASSVEIIHASADHIDECTSSPEPRSSIIPPPT